MIAFFSNESWAMDKIILLAFVCVVLVVLTFWAQHLRQVIQIRRALSICLQQEPQGWLSSFARDVLAPVRSLFYDGDQICKDIEGVGADDVLDALPYHRVWLEQTPPALTALGILGTFIGLWYGVKDIDLTADSNALQTSIGDLVSGLGTAFISSIIGIVCSLLTLFVSRAQLTILDSVTLSLVRLFQRQVFTVEMLIATTLRNILEVQEEQSSSIRTLATDMPARIAEALTPQFGVVANAVNAMGSQSNELHANLLKGVMQSFLSEFRNSVAQQFQELGEVLER
ncbi:MAG: hypothetical protein R3E66_14115, partial [bacterium]